MRSELPMIFVLGGALIAGCASTSLQGYAGRTPPAHTIGSIAAFVVAPPQLATAMQMSLVEQGKLNGVAVEDVLTISPPTRTYSDVEVKKAFSAESIDAVLLLNVGNSSIQREYAGTIFNGQFNSVAMGNTMQTSGTVTGISMPMVRVSQETSFATRLVEPSTANPLGGIRAGNR